MELGDGDGRQGDRLNAGQVGYGEGQTDYNKTQGKDKEGEGSGKGCSRHKVDSLAPTKLVSVSADPTALLSASSGPQTSSTPTPGPLDKRVPKWQTMPKPQSSPEGGGVGFFLGRSGPVAGASTDAGRRAVV